MTRRISWAWTMLVCGAGMLWSGPALGRDQPQPGGDDLESVLDGLEHGVVALEKLGMPEECARLRHVADEVRARLRARQLQRAEQDERRGAPRGRPGDEPGGPEVDVARQAQAEAVEVMRMAVQVLAKAERLDAAEVLERAIRAREVNLERRNDEEAARIREHSPGIADQVELLRLAARLLNQAGEERRAAAAARLADRMWERAGAQRPATEPKPVAGDRPGMEQPAGGPRAQFRQEAMRRLDMMQRQIEELSRALEETRQQLIGVEPVPGARPRVGPRDQLPLSPRPRPGPRDQVPPGAGPRDHSPPPGPPPPPSR